MECSMTARRGYRAGRSHLLNSSNQVVASATTDSQGNYSFNGLPTRNLHDPGSPPARLRSDGPGSGGVTFTPTSGAQITGENFGVYKAVSLAVTGLTTVPSSGLQSSESLVVEWNDTNTGTSAAVGSFYDQIVITNTTTGQQLASGFVQYNAATLGNLAAGASAPSNTTSACPTATPASARSSSPSRPITTATCPPARVRPTTLRRSRKRHSWPRIRTSRPAT